MIISKQKPIDEILKVLRGFDSVFVAGCGICATTCKSGGEKEVEFISQALKNENKTVFSGVIESPCVSSQVKMFFAKNTASLKACKAVLVLSCGSGAQTVKDSIRLNLPVFAGCDTLFSASVSPEGEFREYCSHCAQCVLNITDSICPVTRCAKGLLNGPCGGMNKGKCEVNKDQDCAWVLIYKSMESRGELLKLKEIQEPKDHSKSVKPHKI